MRNLFQILDVKTEVHTQEVESFRTFGWKRQGSIKILNFMLFFNWNLVVCVPVPWRSGGCGAPPSRSRWTSCTPYERYDSQLSPEKRYWRSVHKWAQNLSFKGLRRKFMLWHFYNINLNGFQRHSFSIEKRHKRQGCLIKK